MEVRGSRGVSKEIYIISPRERIRAAAGRGSGGKGFARQRGMEIADLLAILIIVDP